MVERARQVPAVGERATGRIVSKGLSIGRRHRGRWRLSVSRPGNPVKQVAAEAPAEGQAGGGRQDMISKYIREKGGLRMVMSIVIVMAEWWRSRPLPISAYPQIVPA